MRPEARHRMVSLFGAIDLRGKGRFVCVWCIELLPPLDHETCLAVLRQEHERRPAKTTTPAPEWFGVWDDERNEAGRFAHTFAEGCATCGRKLTRLVSRPASIFLRVTRSAA